MHTGFINWGNKINNKLGQINDTKYNSHIQPYKHIASST